MQQAARKVLEENRKLRTLLRTKGVSEDDIDAFLGVEETVGRLDAPPTAELESALTSRKPCCPGGIGDELKQSCKPSPGVQPPTVSVPAMQLAPQLAIVAQNTVPISPHPDISPAATTPTMDFGAIGYQMDSQRAIHAGPQEPISSYPYNNYPIEHHWQQQPYDIQGNDSVPTMEFTGQTSCMDAANIIRSMREGLGHELETDLGCTQLGVNCKVENSVVFDVMEKYGT